MKVLIQRLRDGRPELLETAKPVVQDGHVLIRTRATVVSRGTEQMLLQFGRSNWLEKARQQPEQVKLVLQKIRKDGFGPTWKSVQSKLDQPSPMGYCNAGVVTAVGRGVTRFRIGDRVASNGPHAEWVSVPENLVAAIPENLAYEEAAFAPLGAIALHGLRLAQLTLGETVVVIGLGIVGALAAQLAKANGCRVIGIDPSPAAQQRAEGLGISIVPEGTYAEAFIRQVTGGIGADAVLIASATKDDSPLRLAVKLARAKGRLVLIGTADIHFDRTALFRKELSFVVSSSYGPGRYDASYETQGQDYPLPYVRWTAGRNFEAVLQAMASGALKVKPLIGLRTNLDDFQRVYETNASFSGTALFEFPENAESPAPKKLAVPVLAKDAPDGIGFIGAGNFAQQVLLPAIQVHSGKILAICSAQGIRAGMAAQKFGIPHLAADTSEILEDPKIGQVFIATQHHTHAAFTIEALQAGKQVFVEKPLALTREQLQAVADAMQVSGKLVTVGFNRRFSPLTQKLMAAFPASPELHLNYTINAGILPADHWTVQPETGGGRLLGEVCHFIDLAIFLANDVPETVFCTGRTHPAGSENYALTLRFASGSTASIQYLSSGNSRYPKERIELHSLGKSAVLDNWRSLEIWNTKGTEKFRMAQDKGHHALVKRHLEAASGKGPVPIPPDELMATTATTLAAQESLFSGKAVAVRDWLPTV